MKLLPAARSAVSPSAAFKCTASHAPSAMSHTALADAPKKTEPITRRVGVVTGR